MTTEKYYIVGPARKDPIRKVAIDDETEHYVTINGRRHKKITETECFLDSLDEAKRRLTARANNRILEINQKIAFLQEQVSILENAASNFDGITEDDIPEDFV